MSSTTVSTFRLPIPGVILINTPRFYDERGFFSEVYNRKLWDDLAGDLTFVQDNHSLSKQPGTVRGLHYQAPPFSQAKLVRVTRGAILDVAVDLRRGSPTFGHHVTETLSAENWRQMLVPIGCAHGFCTLEPDTEVIYKTTDFFMRDYDRGIAWDDPDLAIDWPIGEGPVILSEKDRHNPRLADIESPFVFSADKLAE